MATGKTNINDYTINPRNLTQYNAFRGVTDFTNINQFSQYETGYQALFVLQMPYFMQKGYPQLSASFQHMLEYEFKGIDGLPDMTADTMEITDGINTQRLINKVTYDTSATISSEYYEKTGSLITKFSELYLNGIKDKNSQAKTYNGLILDGTITDPGPDKEIFTMLYVATDSTMYRIERAVLLANCQLTKAETSMYNGNRSDINNKPITIEWTCFPIMNNSVDRAAKAVLDKVNGIKFDYVKDSGGVFGNITETVTEAEKRSKSGKFSNDGSSGIIYSELNSVDYKYGVMSNSYNDGSGVANVGGGMLYPTSTGQEFVTEAKKI